MKTHRTKECLPYKLLDRDTTDPITKALRTFKVYSIGLVVRQTVYFFRLAWRINQCQWKRICRMVTT